MSLAALPLPTLPALQAEAARLGLTPVFTAAGCRLLRGGAGPFAETVALALGRDAREALANALEQHAVTRLVRERALREGRRAGVIACPDCRPGESCYGPECFGDSLACVVCRECDRELTAREIACSCGLIDSWLCADCASHEGLHEASCPREGL